MMMEAAVAIAVLEAYSVGWPSVEAIHASQLVLLRIVD